MRSCMYENVYSINSGSGYMRTDNIEFQTEELCKQAGNQLVKDLTKNHNMNVHFNHDVSFSCVQTHKMK